MNRRPEYPDLSNLVRFMLALFTCVAVTFGIFIIVLVSVLLFIVVTGG